MSQGIMLSLGGRSPLAKGPAGRKGHLDSRRGSCCWEFLLEEQLLMVTKAVHLPPAEKRAEMPGCRVNGEGAHGKWSVCQDMGTGQMGLYSVGFAK